MMLRHKGIIEKLSAEQKMELLTRGYFDIKKEEAFLSNTENGTDNLGSLADVPMLKVAKIEELNVPSSDSACYPQFSSLVNSWDNELINTICADIMSRNKNYSAVVAPPLNIKSSVYSDGISEDPLLLAKMGDAFVSGISSSGATPILTGLKLENEDLDYMDLVANKRVICDMVAYPFLSALGKVKSTTNAAIFSPKELNEAYKDINTKTLKNMIAQSAENINFFVDSADSSQVGILRSGNLILPTETNKLADAYENYKRLKDSFDRNWINASDFKAVSEKDDVLDDESLDTYVDRFLYFADRCKRKQSETTVSDSGTPPEDIFNWASSSSIVLLKNRKNTLPLKEGVKLAVIGQSALVNERGEIEDSLISEAGTIAKTSSDKKSKVPSGSFVSAFSQENLPSLEYVGFALGYDINKDRDDMLIKEAFFLASQSDAVLLFLDFNLIKSNAKEAPLVLPPSQLELINQLKRLDKKIIGVIFGGQSVDTDFDRLLDALIVVPRGGSYTPKALINVLCGNANPSGRLAYSLYHSPDKTFSEIKRLRDSGELKIGSFFGYRGYDTAKSPVKYPFGYGQSYTDFIYSGLKSDGGLLKVRVKNVGKTDGTEIVQVYIGKKNSKIVRPLKELKAFRRVFLKAGEMKTISFNIKQDDLSVTDLSDGRRKTEDGKYTVYIGSSVSDIRQTTTIDVSGHVFKQENERISEYVKSLSNIIEGGYVLDGDDSKSTQGKFISKIAKMLNFPKKRKSNPIRRRENERLLSGEPTLIRLFKEEFERLEEEEEQKENILVFEDKPAVILENSERYLEEDTAKYINKNLALKDILSDLVAFMASGGVGLDVGSAKSIISSFLSSRLIIIREVDRELTLSFLSLLSKYFETSFSLDELVENLSNPQRLFINYYDYGREAQTNLFMQMASASASKHLIHTSVIRSNGYGMKKEYLMPLVHYAHGFGRPHSVTVNGVTSLIPSNLWCILVASDDELEKMHSSVFECAAVLKPKIRKLEKQTELAADKKTLTFYQLAKFALDGLEHWPLDESMWKKIDAIEESMHSHLRELNREMELIKRDYEYVSYKIDNGEWRRMEFFTSSILSLGGTSGEAVGSVVSSLLLPKINSILSTNHSEREVDLHSNIEQILGEECAVES